MEAKPGKVLRVDPAAITWLENGIDQLTEALPELKTFIVPGGSPVAAQIQVVRTVCRRAERAVVRLAETEEINRHLIQYLNRLSDLLFMLARWENHQKGIAEEGWTIDSDL